VVQFRDGIKLLDHEAPDGIVLLSERQIARASPRRYKEWRELACKGKYQNGYTDIVLTAIAARLKKYSYFWVIESDVDFFGDWGLFFDEFAECKADLIGTRLRSRSQSPNWYHWSTFVGPRSLDPSLLTAGFFPVVRFSRRFVETYLDELRNGWQGSYEALWPTIALHRGLRVEDIGGCGLFVPPNRRGQWYSEDYFRYRPPVAEQYYPISDAQLPRAQLCHPIKTAAWHLQSHKPRPREQPERAMMKNRQRFLDAMCLPKLREVSSA
jgi:hypothetical protein